MQVLNEKKSNILDFIRGRVIYIADNKEVSRKVFLEKTGMKKGIFDYKDISRAIGSDKISNILDYYNEISSEWLITGKGSMLKETIPVNKQEGICRDINYIPLLPVNAIAGFGSGDWSINEKDIQERYVVPEFNGIDFMIRVKGSSMYPKYNSGDVIACRKLSDTQFIQWNKVYVISTREQGILVKRLDESKQKDCLLAISDNEKYKPFNIPKEDITGMALVIGVIRLE